jgi:hypothetical protein
MTRPMKELRLLHYGVLSGALIRLTGRLNSR